ncbi:ATP-dependent zinc metalloprotease FtsH [Alloiococcus otitis]|uniref:ATP-dependent zinc metalloprotease FtsH n=1 Tax=Alloiococcus otitis ATCC 51267 TaxID=883081 RepID=K9EAQ3_9LACT|nr:ATP-dependent zinc metalloprotease FtsH [Alloiococcus otitis]EKU92886.1 ATP-dependent metallopeptidase HflB [Alloiococcus otitis ATCC 51267]SUU80503.1 ATP-dependent zinc metalloprotease FtsH [Alloiococcus otitis]
MNKKFYNSGFFYILVFIAVIGIAYWAIGDDTVGQTENVSSTEFVSYLEEDRVEEFSIQPNGSIYEVTGTFRNGQEPEVNEEETTIFGQADRNMGEFTTNIIRNDIVVEEVYNLAKDNDIDTVTMEEATTGVWASLLLTLLPMIILIGFFYFIMGRGQSGGGGRGVMNFGKSQAKQTDPEKSKVRFSDVAGADEEKAELVEIVEFLKDPKRFGNLGARIPAGVLLEGPPGTGKTLLAKAVAGEARVPFYSISGSEFVEMFVGVGASRVRDLFENAKKNSPAIIFIDEIDAVGRQRGAGMGGGHDEREQTLNQLLVEMDGFDGNEGIIVMAATNRQDVLDPALLRPGRFDRRILVGSPDVKGREAILNVHAKDKPIADDVDLKLIAKQTPGFSGADLENLLNEAALIAARRRSKIIEAVDMDEAHDRVIAGPAKKDRVISDKQRRMVAFHEAGHTIVGMVLSDARVVHKVTIVPRGRAGGYAIMLPKEDQYLVTKEELFEQIVGLLGGRTSEEIFFNSQTTGASNDFQQATQIARAMVTQYGMSTKLGPVQYEQDNKVFMGRDYGSNPSFSQQFASDIDAEVLNLMNEAHKKAHEIISQHSEQLTLIAEKLLEVETLDANEIKSLFETGKMPEKSSQADKYPRENKEQEHIANDDEQIGTSYEEIKAAQADADKQDKERLGEDNLYTDEDSTPEEVKEGQEDSEEAKDQESSSENDSEESHTGENNPNQSSEASSDGDRESDKQGSESDQENED